MDAPAVDERKHRAAIETAVTATLGPDRVFAPGDVPGLDGNPGNLPPIFAVLTIRRRFALPAKSSRRADVTGWRASVIAAGRTVVEVEWAGLRVAEALDGVRLNVDGHQTTPITHESSRDLKAEHERMASQSAWTYAT